MKQTIVFVFLLFSLTGLLFPPITFAQYQSDTVMPDWFKNNAKWWSEGLITDSDIINGLESLIIQDVIPLDNFVKSSSGIEHQAGVPKGGTFSIPSYQKDVFGFWSDGAVSDSEIVNSIGHLMSEGIINSKKIQAEISERQEKLPKSDDFFRIEGHLGKETDSVQSQIEKSRQDFNLPFDIITITELVQIESDILIANNLSLEQILEMQNFLIHALDDSTEQAWKQYAENKNQDYMNNVIELEKKLNEIKSDSIQTVQIIKDSKQVTDSFFDLAKNNGFDIFILKTTTEQNLFLLDAPSKVRTNTDLNNAEKYVKKFDNSIQTNVDLSNSIIESSLSQNSSYSEAFGARDVEDAPSDYFGIDSRSGATVCEDDSVCDSDTGEVCAAKTGETEGKCIPTWFGIMQEKIIDTRTPEEQEESFRNFSSLDRFIEQQQNRAEYLKQQQKYKEIFRQNLEEYKKQLESDLESTTEPETESSSEPSCNDCIWITSVQFIDGKAYPMFQFMVIPRSSTDDNCPNGTIGPNVMASQSYKTVYHLDFDGTGLTWDENTNNSCGNFGTWGDTEENYPITEEQGNFMKEKFSFDFPFEPYSQ